MLNDFEGRDFFDSRDIDERIEELEALRDDDPEEYDEDAAEELSELVTFRADANTSEWGYGVAFINEDHFEDYARELAEDIGAIPDDIGWPTSYIDWERAAEALQMDYSAVDFGDTTYYYR